ncbi:hypothetical protein BP6252_12863 [Coleophoma cylindrospora]|uniref:Pentatricopeptide repeat domain-containing protein n=1 Tax=Coleophoma cylindrospora TaxID=1849047 RepID=A0A3D8QD39_9HELO|nr:hypothetical protein BP6252_12863 [Coleophoma cylindrospora]
MRPALQKLLSRPSSLDLLTCLTGIDYVPLRPIRRLQKPHRSCRLYSAYALPARDMKIGHDEDVDIAQRQDIEQEVLPRDIVARRVESEAWSMFPGSRPANIQRHRTRRELRFLDESGNVRWTHEELVHQSNLDDHTPTRPRLVDDPKNMYDMQLWMDLLEFRERMFGIEGIKTIYKAMMERQITIPVSGPLSNTFWNMFLELGFVQLEYLESLMHHADDLLKTSGKRWTLLYAKVLQHFLLNGQGHKALSWHRRLIDCHPPGPKGFAEMCRQVVLWNGDLTALKQVYKENNHCNTYSKIVPLLCHQDRFQLALEWHFFLLRNDDVPTTSKASDQLLHYVNSYQPAAAILVKRSLSKIADSTAEPLPNLNLSRETMNLIHGKAFHVPVKKYNDKLGARWFATTWVSLDTAINGVHALGIEAIGPLSLQAIALRELDTKKISQRIAQLRNLGISVGKSVFSRAVTAFAKNDQREYLEGLLHSDQHPDVLEDWKTQEELLASYFRSKDWTQYNRTLAIRVIASNNLPSEKPNLELRCLAAVGNFYNVLEVLQRMRENRTRLQARSIALLVRSTLRPRRRGHQPITLSRSIDDSAITIEIFKEIIFLGGSIQISHWREVIRRQGMSGELERLYRLSAFLATWYGSAQARGTILQSHAGVVGTMARPNSSSGGLPLISSSHSLHPLRQIFSPSLQRSIVEWGFKRALQASPAKYGHMPRHISMNTDTKSDARQIASSLQHVDVTSGITLLQKLKQYGVSIDVPAVRSAVFNRLVTYYGHGLSQRLHNRVAKAQNPLCFEEMVRQVDRAMGGKAFPRIKDLKSMVLLKSLSRSRRVFHKKERRSARKRMLNIHEH